MEQTKYVYIGELTQAALGTVLKTAGTVKRMGIDTSALRILYWVYNFIGFFNSCVATQD